MFADCRRQRYWSETGGLTFATGKTFALFQTFGTCPSRIDALKMAQIGSYKKAAKGTGHLHLHWIYHTRLGSELFDVEYYRDLEMWVRGHSRSLKVVPFESFIGLNCTSTIVFSRSAHQTPSPLPAHRGVADPVQWEDLYRGFGTTC